MDELYEEFEKLTRNHEPFMAAGIMMAQALKIYKTVLDHEEYIKVTAHIINTRDDITELEPPTLQ